MRKAVLTMDVEDWYHLDYFNRSHCDENYSMLDGLNQYLEVLDKYQLPSSFFVLGEITNSLKDILRKVASSNHEIGSHGWDHRKPMTLTLEEFEKDIFRSKMTLEDILGVRVDGYRAPCFSMDRNRLDLVKSAGYLYDSSKIKFTDHPLYGEIDLNGFEEISSNIYRQEDFFEFQVSTEKILGKNIPVSGGGYIRLLPWLMMKKIIGSYLDHSELYVFYIHPFEFSKKNDPTFPQSASWRGKLRFSTGRNSVIEKFEYLLGYLQSKNFEFSTFSDLRKQLL